MTNEDQILFEETTSLCPECLKAAPARLLIENNQVRLETTCKAHGTSHALLSSDAAEYQRLRQYVAPRGTGCCGVGETCGDKPPVCVLLLEITDACNLRCPTCFADASGHSYQSLDEIKARLDAFFKQQSALDVMMLSGGEPTIHPEFESILKLCLDYPVGRILINTNGIRFAKSDRLVSQIAQHRDRVELYLSFSSFKADIHKRLYGMDLIRQKQVAIQKAKDAGIFVTIVATVESGVNDNEIGDLYRYALSMENVNGLTLQPVMTAGRYEHEHVAEERLTLTDCLHDFESQTDGELKVSDFVALPCSHPDCCVLTYGFLDRERSKLIPLPRHLDVARYLDMFSDRISFSGMLGGALRRLWSDTVHFKAGQTARDLWTLFWKGGVREVLPLMNDPHEFGKRVFRIVVKPFMDAHTYDLNRTDQCCTKILLEDGEAVSFCEYNVLLRGGGRRRTFEAEIPLTLMETK